MRRFLIAIGSLAIFPAFVQAQARGGGMGRAPVTAPRFASHVAAPNFSTHALGASRIPAGSHWVRTPSGGLALRVPRRTVNGPGRSGNPGRRLLSQDVPGLGFDYAHFAAVHPNGVRGGHGRFRHERFVGAFFPFFGGGGYWPLFPEDLDEESSADYQQPEAAAAEPPSAYPPYAYGPPPYAMRGPTPEPSNAPAVSPEPDKPADQYVFVRRDGTLFFAVAYMWENGTLRYVTSEGLRRSVAGSALDLDATQQFNEQRGLTFRSPA